MFIGITQGPNSLEYYKGNFKKKPGGTWVNPNDANPATKQWTPPKESTFFPNSWDEKKINEEIALAYNKTPPGGELGDNGNLSYQGIMNDGVSLKMITDPSGKIVSAYPIATF